MVSRSRSTSKGYDATNCAAITSATAARILTPASKPWQRCLRMPMMARLEATVMRPDRVNVNTIACPRATRISTTTRAVFRLPASTTTRNRTETKAKRISRYIDATVGYRNGPVARTCAPNRKTAGLKSLSACTTGVTPVYSRRASAATSTPVTAAVTKTTSMRLGDVAAFTVRTYTPNASAPRPTIWRAFTRFSGTVHAERSIAASSAVHGTARLVRHPARMCHGRATPLRAIEMVHALKTISITASTPLIDCPGI